MEAKELKYWEEGLGLGWKATFKERTGIDPEWFEAKFNESIQSMTDQEYKKWVSEQLKTK